MENNAAPRWYHPALGALLAGYVVVISLGSTAFALAGGILFILACGALARTYRTTTGATATDAGSVGRWATALGALVGVSLIAAWSIGHYTELRWPIFVIAAVSLLGAIVIGRRSGHAVRAELGTAS
ncbi:hypothetical protein [Cryptosporangium sp. NPDC048952]|uniref:hypothetical protein n=1 Tax=Cryptosporangium sp. NPDC048952 TaxID=3363961 RepID=UPI0037144E04